MDRVKGYKVFNPDWTCSPNGNTKQYTCPGKFEEDITPVRCGYGTKTGAKKYVELNPKEEYGTDDLIALYEGNMHWQGISGDKGLGYAYGVNGKTTAYSNGISGNSGSRQDWGM